MWVLAWALGAQAASTEACARRYDAAEVMEAANAAVKAFGRFDEAAFATSHGDLLARLPCVAVPLGAADIGAIHRVQAMRAFLDDRAPAVQMALAGMLAADPGYQFPTATVPEGHPLRLALGPSARLLKDGAGRDLVVLESGWIEVDGAAAPQAPAERAAVLQRIDAQGQVVETRYVWPDDELGEWAKRPAAAATSLPKGPGAKAAIRPKPGLVVGAGVAAVATGSLLALAAGSEATFKDPEGDHDLAELEALRTRANAATVGWVAGAALTAGLGVAVVLTW
jgi:hypothetical protein